MFFSFILFTLHVVCIEYLSENLIWIHWNIESFSEFPLLCKLMKGMNVLSQEIKILVQLIGCMIFYKFCNFDKFRLNIYFQNHLRGRSNIFAQYCIKERFHIYDCLQYKQLLYISTIQIVEILEHNKVSVVLWKGIWNVHCL